MNKRSVAGVLVGAILAGCASHDQVLPRMADRLHSKPLITVRLGIVSVAPEPIVVDLRDEKASISWQAPVGHTFRGKGIEILGIMADAEGRPIPPDPEQLKKPNVRTLPEGQRSAFDCKVSATEVVCAPVAGVVRRGVYRYAIRLLDKDQKPVDGDPYIIPM